MIFPNNRFTKTCCMLTLLILVLLIGVVLFTSPDSTPIAILQSYYANLMLGTNAILVLRHILCIENLLDRWLSWGLLVWAQIVIVETVLGGIGLLQFEWVAGVLTLVWTILWFIAWKRDSSSFNLRTDTVHIIQRLRHIISHFRLEGWLIGGNMALILLLLLMNAVTPPINWDSLTYHLTFPVEWYKQQRLAMVLVPFGDMAPTYYPVNMELVYLWWILPFGSVALADMAQAGFVLMGILAVYNVGRKVGLDMRQALWGASLAGFIPMLLIDGVLWSYSDVAMATGLVVSLNCILASFQRRDLTTCFLAGLSIGLLVGVKTLALLYAIPLFLLQLWLWFNQKPRPFLLRHIVVWSATLIVLGAPAYIRNYWIAGNPFYPTAISIGKRTLWQGIVSLASYRAHPFYTFHLTDMLFEQGYLLHWPLMVSALVLSLVMLGKERHAQLSLLTTPRVILLIPVVLFGIFYFLVPIRDVRYLLPIQMLGSINIAVALSRIKAKEPIQGVLLLVALVSAVTVTTGTVYLLGSNLPPLYPRSATFSMTEMPALISVLFHWESGRIVLLYLFIAGVFTMLVRRLVRLSWTTAKLVTLGGVLIALSVPIGTKYFQWYDAHEYAAYAKYYDGEIGPAWAWLNQNSQNNVIAYAGNNVPLPLYGTSLKNDVLYVRTDAEGYFLHERKNHPFRGDLEYLTWLNNLSIHDVGFLFVTANVSHRSSFPIEDTWASEHPDVFHRLYTSEHVNIYFVDRLALPSR